MFKISFILIFLTTTQVFGQTVSESSRLEKEILDRILETKVYDKRIVPRNSTLASGQTKYGPVIVKTNFYIRSIEYICTKNMEWKLQITFRHQWNDPRLSYNEQNIPYLTLSETSRIWTPDTFISNSKSTEIMNDLKPNQLIRVYPNGNVLYSTRLTTVLSCPMDLRYYPFDKQICSIQIASYGYTTDDIVYLWKEGDPIQVTKNLRLHDFRLEKFLTDYCTSRTNTGEYSCMKADFQFKRTNKEVSVWLIPGSVLTMISFASFWMKPQKSSRVKLLIIILVLLYVLMAYNQRKVSSKTSKNCFLSICLIFVSLTFVELGVLTIIHKFIKRNNFSKDYENRESNDTEKSLVNEEKVKTNGLPECSFHNFFNKRKECRLLSVLDFVSGIVFPLSFIIYLIVFLCSQPTYD